MEDYRLVELIQECCKPNDKIFPLSSYGLKHLFEKMTGCYISNDKFKATMLIAGFKPCKIGYNDRYKIKVRIAPKQNGSSKKS